MEKTIKEEMKREIIHNKLLNENALLIVSKDKTETQTVSVRYIEDDFIKEAEIANLTPNMAIEYNDMMVAVLEKADENSKDYRLISVYDLKHYDFVEYDVLRTIYNSRVNEGQKTSYMKTLF